MSATPVWRCTTCKKTKDLQGDHLKTKSEVRSDCWPCAKKRLFVKEMPGATAAQGPSAATTVSAATTTTTAPTTSSGSKAVVNPFLAAVATSASSSSSSTTANPFGVPTTGTGSSAAPTATTNPFLQPGVKSPPKAATAGGGKTENPFSQIFQSKDPTAIGAGGAKTNTSKGSPFSFATGPASLSLFAAQGGAAATTSAATTSSSAATATGAATAAVAATNATTSGSAPQSAAVDSQWRCTTCNKVKDLQGDHLKGKTSIRSDCWPCAKKRTFTRTPQPQPQAQTPAEPAAKPTVPTPSTTAPSPSTESTRAVTPPKPTVSPTLTFSTPKAPSQPRAVSADGQWHCTVCGKVKLLEGDHLKGKTKVRSDCWPCAKKREFVREEPSPKEAGGAATAVASPPAAGQFLLPSAAAGTASATVSVDPAGPSPKSFNLTSTAATMGASGSSSPSGAIAFPSTLPTTPGSAAAAAAPGSTSNNGSPRMDPFSFGGSAAAAPTFTWGTAPPSTSTTAAATSSTQPLSFSSGSTDWVEPTLPTSVDANESAPHYVPVTSNDKGTLHSHLSFEQQFVAAAFPTGGKKGPDFRITRSSSGHEVYIQLPTNAKKGAAAPYTAGQLAHVVSTNLPTTFSSGAVDSSSSLTVACCDTESFVAMSQWSALLRQADATTAAIEVRGPAFDLTTQKTEEQKLVEDNGGVCATISVQERMDAVPLIYERTGWSVNQAGAAGLAVLGTAQLKKGDIPFPCVIIVGPSKAL